MTTLSWRHTTVDFAIVKKNFLFKYYYVSFAIIAGEKKIEYKHSWIY